jgi:hypothetical protein
MPAPKNDIRQFRFKVRITALGREEYTGKIAKVSFKDGLSENFVSYQEAMSVCATITAEISPDYGDGDLNFSPASPALLAAQFATEREDDAPDTVATKVVLPNVEPLAIKTIQGSEYLLSDSDAGYLLDFEEGCEITVPSGLKEGFYCSLRQGGDDQIEVAGDDPEIGRAVIVEEIDDLFFSEKRLAILHLARFPDGSFQLTGRTGEEQESA